MTHLQTFHQSDQVSDQLLCQVSAKSNLPEEVLENLAATQEASALSPDPSLSAQPEYDDQATASLTKGSRKSNIDNGPEEDSKILTVYSFATRGAAKRHKTKVSAPSLGIDPSASPWTQQRGSQRDDLTKGKAFLYTVQAGFCLTTSPSGLVTALTRSDQFLRQVTTFFKKV